MSVTRPSGLAKRYWRSRTLPWRERHRRIARGADRCSASSVRGIPPDRGRSARPVAPWRREGRVDRRIGSHSAQGPRPRQHLHEGIREAETTELIGVGQFGSRTAVWSGDQARDDA
jgi:hypothetical protein